MAKEERRRVIAVLVEAAKAADQGKTIEFGASDRPRLRIAAELSESGHIDGRVGRDGTGHPDVCSVLGLTTAGRQYLDELGAAEEAESAKGRMMRLLSILGTAVVTLVTTLVAQALGGCLKHGG